MRIFGAFSQMTHDGNADGRRSGVTDNPRITAIHQISGANSGISRTRNDFCGSGLNRQ